MRSIKTAVIVALIFILALTTAHAPGLYSFALTGGTEGLTEETGVYSGIVKENNPSLGYLTLYFQDGSGADPSAFDRLVTLRNFTYGYDIPVLRDGITVAAESIQPGDQVFIRLDEDGYIGKLSAKSYYKPVYGTVHSKNAGMLLINREDGSYVSYRLTPEIPVFKNGRLCSLSDILPGDKVRILVQTESDNIHIAFIELEKLTKPVTGVYRGYVESYNQMRDALAVSGLQEFVNGRWEDASAIGVQSFAFSSEYKIRPFSRFTGTAYFATRRATDGSNRIVMASYRSMPNYELTVKDNILGFTGQNRLELENTSDIIEFDQQTIVIKDGRLVDISALNAMEPIQMSLEKATYSNSYTANVLVCDSIPQDGTVIYRGRIKNVDPKKTITVESFAQLNGITWSFTNTPKTFDIDLSVSRFIEANGVGNMRDVDSRYVGQSMYFVVKGSKIQLLSTAPYAESPVSGRVQSLAGITYDSQGTPLTDPTGLVLAEAMVYDTSDHQWESSNNITMNIPANAIVIRKGIIGTTALIKPGDELQVIRHAQSQEGILVLCN